MKVYMYICFEHSIYEIYAAKIQPCEIVCKHKYCRVLDSQKQWLFLACLVNLLNSCRHFLECLTAQCPRSRDNWYAIDQAV